MSLRCIHPKSTIEIRSTGEAMLCCESRTVMKKSDGSDFNIAHDSIELAWNNPLRSEVNDALERGERHSNCNQCWIMEDAGITSKRLRDTNNRPKNDLDNLRDDQPVWLDLKIGNICNIRCRTCWAGSSTKWMRETYDLYTDKTIPYRQFAKQYDNHKKTLSADNESWQKIEEWLPNLRYIEFYGGEPMYNDHHWNILYKAIEIGAAKNIAIHYNTNGTIFPKEHIDVYRYFKRVGISFSIDGIGKKFEYIRNDAKWEEVLDNIKQWQNSNPFDLENPSHYLTSLITVSLYNLHCCGDTHNFMSQLLKHNVSLNIVHDPNYFNMRNLPDLLKPEMTEHISKMFHNKDSATRINNFMNSNHFNPKLWKQFISVTNMTDRYRNENFQDTFPEYYQMLKPYIE